MKSIEEIKLYLTEHPNQSDKKIAKKLKIEKKDVAQYRQYLGLNRTINDRLVFNIFNKIYYRTLINNISLKLNIFFQRIPYKYNLALILIFITAILIRLIYIKQMDEHSFLRVPLLDAEYYLEWARRINKEGLIGTKVFYVEPLYAYILALLLKITSNYQIMTYIQTFLGATVTLIIAKIAERVFNRTIAVFAAIIAAIYGPFIFYENLLLKTSLEFFMISIFFLVVLYTLPLKRKILYLLCGLLLGIIVPLKGNSLILAPLIVLFILWYHKEKILTKISYAILFSVGFLIIVLSLTLRNYIVAKDFVLTNYSLGIVIYQGSWWGSDGSLAQPPFVRPDPKYEETDSYGMAASYNGGDIKPSQASSFWLKKSFEEIFYDPGRYIGLEGKKILLLITRVELGDNYDYGLYSKYIPILKYLPDFWIVASLAMTGFILSLISKDFILSIKSGFLSKNNGNETENNIYNYQSFRKIQLLFVGVIAAYCLVVISGHVNSRYRVAITPLFIIMAMATVWYLIIKIKNGFYFKAGLIIVLFVSFLFLSSVHLDNFDSMTDSNFYNNLASYYLDNNQQDLAYKYFQKAKNYNNEFAYAYTNLFYLDLKKRNFKEAKNDLTGYIALRPDDPSGYAMLAVYDKLKGKPAKFINETLNKGETVNPTGRYDQYFYEFQRYLNYNDFNTAEKYLEMSAKKYNKPENTMINMAYLKKKANKTDEAKVILEEMIRKNKYFLAADYNLANIYIKQKNYKRAALLLQNVYNYVPEFGETWYYLAVEYLADKNYIKAYPLMQGYINKYKDDPGKSDNVAKFKSMIKVN